MQDRERPLCLECGGPLFEEHGEWFHYGVPGSDVTHDAIVASCCHDGLQVHPIEQSVEGQCSCCHEHEVGGEG